MVRHLEMDDMPQLARTAVDDTEIDEFHMTNRYRFSYLLLLTIHNISIALNDFVQNA
jgi:hypothetical protein